MSLPPRNPVDGALWKDGGITYVFVQGRGWVAERFIIGARVDTGPVEEALKPPILINAPEPTGLAGEPANRSRLTRRIEAARVLAAKLVNAADRRVVIELTQSARVVQATLRQLHTDNLALRARLAELETQTVTAVTRPPRKCDDCGGPRSPSSSRRCKACQALHQTKVKPPPAFCACGAAIGPCSKQCRPCYTGAAQERQDARIAKRRAARAHDITAPPPSPPPAAEPVKTKAGGFVEKAGQRLPVVARLDAPTWAPPTQAVSRSLPPGATKPEKGYETHSRPPVSREQHPILERAARSAPVDPLAKPRHEPRPEIPGFSAEFEEKLRRVAAGAGIVEVRPIARRDDQAGGGSSLDFI